MRGCHCGRFGENLRALFRMSELMIDVSGLTKRYAGATAVRDVSFAVGRGQIVGLLGKNGAGKSTILKILSCFLPATSGTVRVAGYDVFHDADDVRRRIGYMPENNPLHMEMRVKEYLKFRARLKGLSMAQTRERVDTVLQQCTLTDVYRRIIGQLSKGYKQRVGLADALVHEPELIILDEPTIGLDPNQIRSVRQLIKDLGKRHTILLSTHILSEVEVTCSHVLVLHRGKMLASDSIENLQRKVFESGAVVAEIAAPVEELTQCWQECEAVQSVDLAPADAEFYRCMLTARDGEDLRPVVFDLVRERGWKLRELTRGRVTLEEVFVKMTREQDEVA
jgi:ABC-2 type transport system ATP-binding protein